MSSPLRIAVADDEPVVREYFCTMLPLLGHQVVAVAQNGRELVDACCTGRPDLIIADVRMPDMDGDEALHEICLQRPTPFILISAYSKPVDSQNGFGDVAWTCLTKPIKREDLEKAIQSVCPQARIEQE
jgi:two-component system, response regulator PdtaR